jgi:hypothetical protein
LHVHLESLSPSSFEGHKWQFCALLWRQPRCICSSSRRLLTASCLQFLSRPRESVAPTATNTSLVRVEKGCDQKQDEYHKMNHACWSRCRAGVTEDCFKRDDCTHWWQRAIVSKIEVTNWKHAPPIRSSQRHPTQEGDKKHKASHLCTGRRRQDGGSPYTRSPVDCSTASRSSNGLLAPPSRAGYSPTPTFPAPFPDSKCLAMISA